MVMPHFLFEPLQLTPGDGLAVEERWASRLAWPANLESWMTMQMGVRDPSMRRLAIAVPDGHLF
jgi:hypothetical protein